jgi:hypothetical protein
VKHWKKCQELIPGEVNVHDALVDAVKVFLLPLHIKLLLVKNSVKALQKDDLAFSYLRQKLLCLSKAKIKEGIFVGPHIRKLTKSKTFNSILN